MDPRQKKDKLKLIILAGQIFRTFHSRTSANSQPTVLSSGYHGKERARVLLPSVRKPWCDLDFQAHSLIQTWFWKCVSLTSKTTSSLGDWYQSLGQHYTNGVESFNGLNWTSVWAISANLWWPILALTYYWMMTIGTWKCATEVAPWEPSGISGVVQ